MPSTSCHPLAPHIKLRLPDWFVSSLMLDRAVDAIIKRLPVDRDHDIPYLAGYSTDGTTIYIDRHIPRSFRFRGRTIDTDRYLILHEAVEKTLIDQLGLHYQHAHQIATRAEEAAVRADKVDWRAYDRFMQQWVKLAGDERLTRLPDDLDLKPYRDEHDTDLLKRMQKAMRSHPAPVRAAVAAFDRHLAARRGEHLHGAAMAERAVNAPRRRPVGSRRPRR